MINFEYSKDVHLTQEQYDGIMSILNSYPIGADVSVDCLEAEEQTIDRLKTAFKDILKVSDVWQPIETAPKDGRRILVYSKIFQCRGIPEIARYIDNEWILDGRNSYGNIIITNPSHWAPVLNPPQETEQC